MTTSTWVPVPFPIASLLLEIDFRYVPRNRQHTDGSALDHSEKLCFASYFEDELSRHEASVHTLKFHVPAQPRRWDFRDTARTRVTQKHRIWWIFTLWMYKIHKLSAQISFHFLCLQKQNVPLNKGLDTHKMAAFFSSYRPLSSNYFKIIALQIFIEWKKVMEPKKCFVCLWRFRL